MTITFPLLDAKKAELKRIFEEAGPDLDLSRVKSLTGDQAAKVAHIKNLNEEVEELQRVADQAASGAGRESGDGARGSGLDRAAKAGASDWAIKTADSLAAEARKFGVKALTVGSIDIPSLISTSIISNPFNPVRLIDVLITREAVAGNEFEYLRQTTRTNNAEAVPDHSEKPTSIFEVTPITDRVRVIAHLSEPIPERFFADHRALLSWLDIEMRNGVLEELEQQIVSGNAVGENLRGILNTVGIQTQSFTTNTVTTLRKARTKMETSHEEPTAWVLHPTDAEALDLLREATDGMFLSAGPGLSNILGDIPRIISTSVPAGTALLADWRQVRLVTRELMRLDADRSGEHFKKNEVVLRAEGRFGIGVLRPQAFTMVDLTP